MYVNLVKIQTRNMYEELVLIGTGRLSKVPLRVTSGILREILPSRR